MRGCLICWKCARRLALIDLQRAAVNLRVLPPISKICQFSFSALLSPAVVLGWKRKNNIKALYYLEIQMDNFQKTHCWAFLGWWDLLYTITGSSWCKHLFLMTVNVESLVYGCSVAFSISKAWKEVPYRTNWQSPLSCQNIRTCCSQEDVLSHLHSGLCYNYSYCVTVKI